MLSRHSRAMNRRRSRSRPSDLPKQCTRLSSFARHPHRSTCKRSSKSCSQRRSTSNVSSLRSKGSVSPCCSTSTFESFEWIDQLIRSALCIRADCTHTRCLSISRRDATYWVGWPSLGLDPPAISFRPPQYPSYISPFVHSCIICRRFGSLLLLHITLCLINLSLYSSHMLQPARLSIFQAVYFPRLLVCFTLGGPR